MALKTIDTTGDERIDRELDALWRATEAKLNAKSARVAQQNFAQQTQTPTQILSSAQISQYLNSTKIVDGSGINLNRATDNTILISGTTDTLVDGVDFVFEGGNLVKVFNLYKTYGADNTGSSDCSSLVATAFSDCLAAGGGILYFAAGVYRFNSLVDFTTSVSVAFNFGVRVWGAGSLCTTFKPYFGSTTSHLFKVDTNASSSHSYAQVGVEFQGFTISGSGTSSSNASGIYMRHTYHGRFNDVYITSLAKDGIYFYVVDGDNDGCTNITIDNCRIDGCQRWGINCDNFVGPGVTLNQLSFLTIRDSFITGNGTDMSATPYPKPTIWDLPPTSGGMRWKGQSLCIIDSAITENYNVGFFNFYDGCGQALLATFINVDFENNKNVHAWWQGCDQVRCINTRIVSSSVKGKYGVLLDTAPYYQDPSNLSNQIQGASSCAAHTYDGVFVKVTSAVTTPTFWLFKANGVNFFGLRIIDVNLNSWDNGVTYVEYDTSLFNSQARPVIIERGYTWNFPWSMFQYEGTTAAGADLDHKLRQPAVTTNNYNIDPFIDKFKHWYIELAQTASGVAQNVNFRAPVTDSVGGGKEFWVIVYNNRPSGESVTVTWDAGYKVRGFKPPLSGQKTMAMFTQRTYDPGAGPTGEWMQMTDWTEPTTMRSWQIYTISQGAVAFTVPYPAATEFNSVTTYRTKADLGGFDSVRLTARVDVADGKSPHIKLQYSLNESTWTDLGADVDCTSVGTNVSSWTAIPEAARGDVFLRLMTYTSALAAGSITFGAISIQGRA